MHKCTHDYGIWKSESLTVLSRKPTEYFETIEPLVLQYISGMFNTDEPENKKFVDTKNWLKAVK